MFTVENRGPTLAVPEIERLEAHLGFRLVAAYRQFLLDNNGGKPVPDCVDVPEFGETDVQVFFGIGRTIESSCIPWNLDTLRNRLSPEFVPIACDSGGNLFCLTREGAIIYLDLESVFGDLEAPPPTFAVAPTFDAFLAGLGSR